MIKIHEKILGEEGKVTFEERVINVVLLIAMLMTIIGMILNILFHANIVVDIVFLTCWLLAYLFKHKFEWAIPLAYGILVFAVVPYNWINSSGIHGALPFYSIVFISVISVTTRGWQRRLLVISLMMMQLGLIYYDSIRIGSISGLMYIATTLHLSVLTGSMGILLFAYSNTYSNEKKRNQAYAKAIEDQSRQQLYCMGNLEELNTKLKSERHDFNNHLGVIHGLMAANEFEKTLNYTTQLVKKEEEYRNVIDIPYAMIRAMLNYKLSFVTEKNIDFNIEVNIPSGLKINEFDIGILLGNLIDNAITSLENVEKDKRYLNILINFKPDYLVIRIENPYSDEVDFKNHQYFSTKSDKENHGYGLNYVKQIVKKYDGLIKINHENQLFLVDIAVLIMP